MMNSVSEIAPVPRCCCGGPQASAENSSVSIQKFIIFSTEFIISMQIFIISNLQDLQRELWHLCGDSVKISRDSVKITRDSVKFTRKSLENHSKSHLRRCVARPRSQEAMIPAPGNKYRRIRLRIRPRSGVNCRDSVPIHIPRSRYVIKGRYNVLEKRRHALARVLADRLEREIHHLKFKIHRFLK